MRRRELGFRVSRGQSYASIERTAQGVRRVVAPTLGPGDPINMVALFERLDEYCVKVGDRKIYLDYAVRDFTGIEAITIYDDEDDRIVVVLSTKTYLALQRGDNRPLFTVAHEIGHAVLHAEEVMAAGTVDDLRYAAARGKSSHKIFMDSEWQSDVFAAALLMPAEGVGAMLRAVESTWEPSEVQAHFNVSGHAATTRCGVVREKFPDYITRA